MKKIQLLLLSGLLTLSSINVFAGDDDGGKNGIRAGWQYANFYDNGSSLGDPINFFYAGFYREKKLIPLLRLGYGLEYNSVGFKTKNVSDTQYTRHTLAIPVYARLKLGLLFAVGGVAPGVGLANKSTLLGEDVDLTDKEKTNAFDAPVFLGLGIKIAIVSIEARYHWGTMNLSKQDDANFTQQYLQIGAAVSF